jgi:hypothetical protein
VHGAFAEASPSASVEQRWTAGRHSWARRSEGGFDASRFSVGPLAEAQAKDFVVEAHYSGTYPAASRRYGLWAATSAGPLLAGVAVFGIPAQARVLTNVFPGLVPYTQALELSRFVLTSDLDQDGVPVAPGNSESWFLARCFELLRDAGVRGVVSFADPVPRRLADGTLLFPGHVGTIYQASGAVFTGRGTPRALTVLPDGTSVSDRALQKVRAGERGSGYVERRLVALGAPVRRPGQSGSEWLPGALDSAGARRLRHGGNFRYAMVTSRADRRGVTIGFPPGAYPKSVDV